MLKLLQSLAPEDWLQANVAPIYKKGEKYDPANYRPVSLTCICCKSLEYIIVSKIMQHLSEDKILVESQHGFRSGRSCETQLVQFIHDLQENLDGAHNRGHKQTDLIIMDFAKAFDKVPIEDCSINWNTMVSEMIPSSGPLLGYLVEHKKSCLMVFAQTPPSCCLVFHRATCWGLYYS